MLTVEHTSFFLKVVYALSCIIRNYPDAEVSFGKTYGYAVFHRAVSSGIPAFATRAVFLSNALITSDSSSEEIISAIAPAFLPGSYLFVSSTDTDLREATLRLLISLAKTTAGKALFASAAGVEDAIQARTKTLMTDPDNVDQEKHEQSLIKEFREALLAPVSRML